MNDNKGREKKSNIVLISIFLFLVNFVLILWKFQVFAIWFYLILILWFLFSCIFLCFRVFSVQFSFLPFIIRFLRFMQDSFLIIYIIFSVILFVYIFNISADINSKTANSVSFIKDHYPYLEMEVVEAPKGIDDPCQKTILKLKVKNIGAKDLSFEDLKNDLYRFYFCYSKENTCFPFSIEQSVLDNGDGSYSVEPSYIDDFSVIKPGEEKMIYIHSGGHLMSNGENYDLFNDFAKTSGGNKVYDYEIELQAIVSESRHYPLGRSNSFSVFSNVVGTFSSSDGSTYTAIKECK